jgi:predicted DNA-binding transcriptional regulator YafY
MPDRPGRLFALVDYLSGRRARTPDEIAEHFGYSKRSVYRDLASLHDAEVALVRRPK